ncbi:Bro-N domain-containing protein, partial [Pseudomonas sp. HY13-MNA-CIBAN-0226]|uniref:BRO-N domain-containing protein n=1 Tax=Pseudomonas sp. HY13-MNA-CIBAN-0226 TaxID=3140473 RepID=UPI00331D2992
MQTAKIIPFHFDTQQVRTVLIDDQPWFVAADVASALRYLSAKDMTRNLDDDEKGGQIVPTPGGDQEMTVISESGLYSAILRSRKTEAKRFKKWVTAEVLPAIRKQGRYEDTDNRMATLVGQTIGTDGFHMLGAVVKGKVSSLPA